MHRLLRNRLNLPLDEVVRREGGAVLATLIRMTGDFDVAEDALQDAAITALETWPTTGVPVRPGAWLTTVARRKVLDRIRRDSARPRKETEAVALLAEASPEETSPSAVDDNVLRLVFTCCHPALSPEARLALTLRTVCGLTTAEIAAVFLVPETTMAQRITRAKRKIAIARIPYRVPADHELSDRVDTVLAVVHALYTAGHHAPSGDVVVRCDLADEAIRLARVLVRLLPDEPESAGLLALLLATDARRAARVDAEGEIVLLRDQDRSLWDHGAIDEAAALVEAALRRRRPGRFQLQAAIACLHSLAAHWSDTDWPQIAQLYAVLEQAEPTPVVRVNRAIAEAEVNGPGAGLDILDGLQGLERWHLFWATRGDFLRRLGRRAEAGEAYRKALGCPCNEADRRFLHRRLTELG